MADKKISALTASTTPLAGTEVLPIVQSGVTKQVSIANLTAGRAVTASQLDVDNIRVDGNTVSSTNTNGDIILDPDGTGVAVVQGVSGAATGTVNAPITMLIKDTQEVSSGGDITNAWGKLKWSTVDASSGGPGGGAEIGVSYVNQFGVGTRMYIATSETNAAPKKRMQFEPFGNVIVYQNDGTTIHSQFVSTSGNLNLNLGNLVIGTAGKGIDFSADGQAAGMTSELLDDYEEGTWTPLVAFGGASVDLVTAVSSGKYTKIGNVVYYAAEIYFSNKGSSTGAATVQGLPFTIGSMAMAAPSTTFHLSIPSVNLYSSSGTALALFVPGTGGGVAVTDANFTNASGLVITGMYFI